MPDEVQRVLLAEIVSGAGENTELVADYGPKDDALHPQETGQDDGADDVAANLGTHSRCCCRVRLRCCRPFARDRRRLVRPPPASCESKFSASTRVVRFRCANVGGRWALACVTILNTPLRARSGLGRLTNRQANACRPGANAAGGDIGREDLCRNVAHTLLTVRHGRIALPRANHSFIRDG